MNPFECYIPSVSRGEPTQLNIRSRFARERAAMLARETGMTATQIVEEALRSYMPPSKGAVSAGLVREGAILVRPARDRRVSLRQAEAALAETRGERG